MIGYIFLLLFTIVLQSCSLNLTDEEAFEVELAAPKRIQPMDVQGHPESNGAFVIKGSVVPKR